MSMKSSPPKPPRPPSLVRWYALTTEVQTNEPRIIQARTQKELKKLLKEQDEEVELRCVIKGRLFAFKVQRSFEFVDAPDEVEVSETPPPPSVM